MGAMADPIIGGHLTGLTRTFGWAFGLNAFASLIAGFIIGYPEKAERIYKERGSQKKY